MKETDPIQFAGLLLKYCQNDLPAEQKNEVEKIIRESPRLQQLMDELQHRPEMDKQLALISSFHVDKALKKVRTPRKKTYLYLMRIASVVLLAFFVVATVYFSNHQTGKPRQIQTMEIGNGKTVLRLASGEVLSLDTLSSSSEEGVYLENRNGELQVKSQSGAVLPSADTVLHTVEVPYKGTYKLLLPDGTRVCLNSGSSLKFPSAFAGKERKVFLSGEAYFDVHPDKVQKFIVETKALDVRVTGTSFDIKAYSDEELIYATLVSGSISIRGKGLQEREILPGEQLILDKVSKTSSVRNVDAGLFTAWKDGFFYFKDAPLDDIMKRLERWYNIRIVYTDPGLQKTVYSGKMKMYESVDDILRKFEKSGGLHFEFNENTITISPK